MAYQYQISKEKKGPWVDRYFEINQVRSRINHFDLIIPDCTPGLMYIREGSLVRVSSQRTDTFTAGKLLLFGQKTKAVYYGLNDSQLKAVGAKLAPSALYTLFHIAAKELTNQVVEVDLVDRRREEIIALLESKSLIPSMAHNKIPPAALPEIMTRIHRSNGMISIQEISRQMGVGYKRMERWFHKHVGVTPKMYARIVRFNYCVKLGVGDHRKLTDLAYQSGFFDQNHFIKEIKSFTGMVPSELFGEQGGIEGNHLHYLKGRGY